jgi:hypothetical protein
MFYYLVGEVGIHHAEHMFSLFKNGHTPHPTHQPNVGESASLKDQNPQPNPPMHALACVWRVLTFAKNKERVRVGVGKWSPLGGVGESELGKKEVRVSS